MLRGLLLAALLLGTVGCSDVKRAASGDFTPATPGKLVVATELPAPGFWDGNDPATVHRGFEWALAETIAADLGLDLTVRQVPFTDIVAGRLHGADLALAQVSFTDQRAKVAELTGPYYNSSPAALARRGTEGKLADLATARQQLWAVQKGTTLETYLTDVVRPDQKPLVLPTTDAVVKAVTGGDADVALLDLPTALTVAGTDGLSVPARFAQDEEIVGVLPPDSDNLQSIDQELDRLLADGTVDKLRKKWLDPVFAVDPTTVPVILTHE